MVRSSFSTLTRELDDPTSPLTMHLRRRFPHVREVQRHYRESAGPLLVPSAEANPGTVGTAFELLVSCAMDSAHVPSLAYDVCLEASERVALDQVGVELHSGGLARHQLTEPVARAAWALALCIEVGRMGGEPLPGSTFDVAFDETALTADRLLALATPAAIDTLSALHNVARSCLYPALPSPPNGVAVGPTFECSRWCQADADLVVGDLLLELKTSRGRTTSAGTPADRLPLIDLYQLVGYLIFDSDDRYSIRRVGWYSARYGNLVIWDAGELLAQLSDEPSVDLAYERDLMVSLLRRG